MNLKDAAAFLGLPRPLDRMILLHDPPFTAPLIGRNDLGLAMAFSRQSLEEWSRERMAGILAVEGGRGRRPAFLHWFILDEEVRGTGAGRKMLGAAVAFCDSQRFPQLELWTFDSLEAARGLYLRFGFTIEEAALGNRWGREVLEQRYVRKRGAFPASPCQVGER